MNTILVAIAAFAIGLTAGLGLELRRAMKRQKKLTIKSLDDLYSQDCPVHQEKMDGERLRGELE